MEIGNDCWLRVGLAFNYISRVLLTSVIAPCNQCLSLPTTVGGAKNAHPCEGRSPVMTNDWRRKGSVLLHCETGSQDLSLDRHTNASSCHTLLHHCWYGDQKKMTSKSFRMSHSYFCALNPFSTSFSDCRYVLATNTRPRPTARDCQNQNKENILFTNLSCITTDKGSHGRALI